MIWNLTACYENVMDWDKLYLQVQLVSGGFQGFYNL
jgi:hypothetical protein